MRSIQEEIELKSISPSSIDNLKNAIFLKFQNNKKLEILHWQSTFKFSTRFESEEEKIIIQLQTEYPEAEAFLTYIGESLNGYSDLDLEDVIKENQSFSLIMNAPNNGKILATQLEIVLNNLFLKNIDEKLKNTDLTITLDSKKSKIKEVLSSENIIFTRGNREKGTYTFDPRPDTRSNKIYLFFENKKEPSPEEPIRANMENNSARILIWVTSDKQKGHIGMILKNKDGGHRHISLYQDNEAARELSTFKKVFYTIGCCKPASFVTQYFEDGNGLSTIGSDMHHQKNTKTEKTRHPNHIIDVKNLDVDAMIKYLGEERDLESQFTWRALGNNACLFTKRYQNCASICYESVN